jgi:hypothetical protein
MFGINDNGIANNPFLESEIARVDPSGNDGIGVIGDLSKPFLTVQGAIDAVEDGSFTNPVVDIANLSSSEDVTTALAKITFVGINPFDPSPASIINSLTLTNTTEGINLSFSGVSVLNGISAANPQVNICVSNGSILTGLIENTDGDLLLTNNGGALDIATITATGNTFIKGFLSAQNDIRIDCPGANVVVQLSRVRQVINANVLTLQDGRVEETNSATSTVYDDTYLTPRWENIGGDPSDNGDFTDWLYDDQGVVYQFIDKFELSPQGSAPAGPFEGMIYGDAVGHHLYYYNGTTFKQLDNELGVSGYSGFCGLSGYSGFCGLSGYSGYSSTSGYSGYSSASGYSGFCGLSGYSGYCGLSGYSGYSGSGLSGYSGYSGSGVSGYSGYSGSGLSGYSGFCGLSGYSGYSGPQGTGGNQGIQGTPGTSGYSGFCGLSGYSGFCGLSGYSGFCGLSGYSGYSSTSGYSGYCGLSGYSGYSGSGISGYSGYSGSGISGYSGYSGIYGGISSLYLFDTATTDSDPGSGKLKFNNATLSSVTTMYIDIVDNNGTTVTGWLDSWDDVVSPIRGTLEISKQSDITNYVNFNVTGAVVSGANYRKITLTYISSNGATFAASDKLLITFAIAGASGYSGYCGLSGYSGFCGLSGYSGYSSTSGYSGYSSTSGYSGYCGLSGYSGYSGSIWRASITVESPSASENIAFAFTTGARTISKVIAVVKGSSPSVTYNIGYGTDITSLTNVTTSPSAVTNTTTGTTATLNNTAIPANGYLVFTTSAKSGTITWIQVTVEA